MNELSNKEIKTDNAETLKNIITELEEQNKNLQVMLQAERELKVNADYLKKITELEAENAELKKIAEYQQSSNMKRFFEIKKLKEGLEAGSILNRGIISTNSYLEGERNKYRNMVFDLKENIADLEKENAELKARNKWYSEQICNKECAEVWGSLTKAKENLTYAKAIMRELLDNSNEYARQNAEDFIKEIDK